MPRKLEDLTGQPFGKLTVEKYAGIRRSGKSTASFWWCKCDCGSENVLVSNNNLRTGSTTSCGCFQKERARDANLKNLAEQRFGMLTVLEYDGPRESTYRVTLWKCKCDCGNVVSLTTTALKNGQKSCGCKQGWWRSPMPGLWKDQAAYSKWRRQDPLIKLRHGVSSSIRSMIKHNGDYKRKKSIRNYLPYTIEELKAHLESKFEPWMNWENYGGTSDNPEKTWHIDHINAHVNFPYTSMDDPIFVECWSLSNLQPLEKKANMSKGAKSM